MFTETCSNCVDATNVQRPTSTCRPWRALLGGLLLLVANSASAAVAIDVTTSRDQSPRSTTATTASFSTTSGNELLLAFIATDYISGTNTTVTSVTGAGLNWVLVRRTNVQSGTAEIWRAFAPSVLTNVTATATLSQSVVFSMTVMSFTGVETSGTNGSGAIGATGTGNAAPGAPSATLVTTRNGSLVLGVGNDYDKAIARTPGAGQVIVHPYLAPVGDTYWVQRQSSATPLSGTSVAINDTAPTGDRYNLTIAEVLAPAAVGSTFSISGAIAPTASGTGATVTLTQNTTTIGTATVDSFGNYAFANVPNGTYVVTPVKTGLTFSPANQTVVVNGGNVIVPTFTATAVAWSISGAITPAASGTGTTVTLTQNTTTIGTATVDSFGNYAFANVPNGTYVVTPVKTGLTFSPANQTVVVNGGNVIVPTFTATAVAWSISGAITPAASGSGTVLTLSPPPTSTTTADGSGNYSFGGLANGTYTVTPGKTGFTFSPTQQTVMVNGANVPGINFAAQSAPPSLRYPNLSDIIPQGAISIVQSGGHRMFQYTHDTFNGGPGPLVIQPALNPASGAYQGTQYIYTLNGSTWSIGLRIPVAGAFVFDADHGHFHFPFTSYGLYTVGADGGPGTALVTSGKVSFCIDDSFIYDRSLPNAGQIGNLGPCSDPTSLRGLNIGAVDEYDQTDAGQAMNIDGLPDGTYWLKALVDPNNFLADANKSNNETDTKLTITGNSVQVLQTVVPVLAAPPAITLTSPSGTISGIVSMTATTDTGSGVQMLVDGQLLGSPIPGPPYTLNWDTTTVPDGTHWLAAQTTGPSGVIGTSPVVIVTVANAGTAPPSVQITSPSNGATVSSTVTLFAQAASGHAIVNVTFFVDGTQIGQPVTAAPYMIAWDTTTATDGSHALTATALDSSNLTATSAPITVNVDNTHPPLVIGKDATVFIDGSGTMITPAFSTATAGDLLIAFVGYDGPASAQTATVSGAGLTWTLVVRSNTQRGTSEIWTARPTATLVNATVQAVPGAAGYHGSLTVIAFTNAAGIGVVGRAGAPSGAPDIVVPGAVAGDWVFAVGNDWDSAVARTPVSGQVLVHQRVDTSTGDTYWVQSTAAPSTANALVDIHDNAPTADQWNYAVLEIVAKRQ